jgi:hypothetical protein
MPTSPSSRLGLVSPIGVENANGPDLAQDLIDQLEAKVGMVKIAQAVPASGVVTFASIPQVFKHLRIVGIARSDSTLFPEDPGAESFLLARFNASAAAAYWYRRVRANNSSFATDAATVAATVMRLGSMMTESTGFSAADLSSHQIDVFDYTSANNKGVQAESSRFEISGGTSQVVSERTHGQWRNTAPITDIVLSAGSVSPAAYTLDPKTDFTLYGMP